jgi:hypothetical protein
MSDLIARLAAIPARFIRAGMAWHHARFPLPPMTREEADQLEESGIVW